MLSLLEADALDAAFSLIAGSVPDGLASLRVSDEEVVAAYPPGEAPEQESVSAADLAGIPLAAPRSGSAIKALADEFFARAGQPFNLTLESGDPYLIRCLVSDGFSAAVLPASLARREGPPVETRPLRPPISLPVYVLWRRGRHRSAAATAFIDFVRESIPEARIA
jgi:DNA-binding transcriptional LysR family regulator